MTKNKNKLPVADITQSSASEATSLVPDEVKNKKTTVRNYRSHAKKVVGGKFANIMVKMAERSEDGSLAHTKYLFEIGGVKEDIHRQKQSKSEPSLAKLLLAEVRKRRASTFAQGETGPSATREENK